MGTLTQNTWLQWVFHLTVDKPENFRAKSSRTSFWWSSLNMRQNSGKICLLLIWTQCILSRMPLKQQELSGRVFGKKHTWQQGQNRQSDACPVNSGEQSELLIHGLVWRICPFLPARIAVLQCWEKWWAEWRSGCEKTRLKPVLYIEDSKDFWILLDICLYLADK